DDKHTGPGSSDDHHTTGPASGVTGGDDKHTGPGSSDDHHTTGPASGVTRGEGEHTGPSSSDDHHTTGPASGVTGGEHTGPASGVTGGEHTGPSSSDDHHTTGPASGVTGGDDKHTGPGSSNHHHTTRLGSSADQTHSSGSETTPATGTISTGSDATLSGASTTPGKICDEMEYIETLITSNSIQTKPTQVSNIKDFHTQGCDFTDKKPTIVLKFPAKSATVQNVKVLATNVKEIEVVFTTDSGSQTAPIRGSPTNLPTDKFTTEKVVEVTITITETTDSGAPKSVRVSIIACAPGVTPSTGVTSSATTHTSVSGISGGQTTPVGTGASADQGTHSSASSATGTISTGSSLTSSDASTTPGKICEEMEYIETLITSNSIQTKPTQVSSIKDFHTQGCDFTDKKPTIVLKFPAGAATVQGITVSSTNVKEIGVTFETESGNEATPILGSPTNLPTNKFPTEKVVEISITITKTSDGSAPKSVRVSIIACAPGVTPSTSTTSGSTGATTPSDTNNTGSTPSSSSTSSGSHSTSTGTTGSGTTVVHEKCTTIQEVIHLGADVFSTVTINKQRVQPAAIPTALTVTKLPFEIRATLKKSITLHEVSVTNPSESQVSVITVSTDQTEQVSSTNTNAPAVTFETDVEQVTVLIIQVVSTTSKKIPTKSVTLSILACVEKSTIATKGGLETGTTSLTSSVTGGASGSQTASGASTGSSDSPSGSSGSSTSPSGSAGLSGSPSGPAGTSDSPSGPSGSSASPSGPAGLSGSPSGPAGSSDSPSGPSGSSTSPSGPAGLSVSPSGPAALSGSPSGPAGSSVSPSRPAGLSGSPSGPVGPSVLGSTSSGASATPSKICDEIEYIDTLITSNAIQTKPTQVSNIKDFHTQGCDFTDKKPTIVLKFPASSATIQNVKVLATNVKQIEVVFTTESGSHTAPIRGSPANLPTDKFPTDKVVEVTITITETSDSGAPKSVRVSIIACAPGVTPSTGEQRCATSSATNHTEVSGISGVQTTPAGLSGSASGPNGPSSGSPSGPHSEGPNGPSSGSPSGPHSEGPNGPSSGSPSGPHSEGPNGPSSGSPSGPHSEGPNGPSSGSPSGPHSEGPNGPSSGSPSGPHSEGPNGPSSGSPS
ncbi:unnamed protein product, partial [Adineta steineri]